ncbi:prephenate dehydrogenase [Bifidobacterium simiarum]|uniref:prephenate dehydrogenase n=1 Tax=Bifidobacterium simiarum TaxID=2045441 RepID=UPI001BDD2DA3|nr:prephenate dehydrogenase/arogenate dehydrogenase family protein [Bifidobacterium simiarum]MBT1165713.1 prephenate dehydrogenase/arogenate dehydrogenase family protein [Bifidobacterium simiarum]
MNRDDGLPKADVIAIAGLGLIGGSLARRLTARGRRVIAWNHRDAPYAEARRAGIECVARVEDLAAAKPDVLVLCTPLRAMPDVLARLAPVLDEATTLTDVGSVKGQVRDEVKAVGLDDRYVGAHPMAGNELSGYAASDPGLYDDALWAVTYDGITDYARLLTVTEMIVRGVGNRVIVLDDDTHDRAAALISHMPHVVATALANELTETPERNIAQALAAGSWRDMTRVALTDPDRTRAMVEEDADNVARLLRSVSARLAMMADVLEREGSGDPEDVGRALDESRGFFAAARPYREFKARQRARESGTASGAVSANESADAQALRINVTETGWRDELLESAKRGEHIVGIESPTTFAVQVRTALV